MNGDDFRRWSAPLREQVGRWRAAVGRMGPRGRAAAVGVAGLAGLMGLVLGVAAVAGGRGAGAADDGSRIRIEIVQPEEPVLIAGPVIEVGRLVDAFDPTDLPPPVPAAVEESAEDWGEASPVEADRAPGGMLRRLSSAMRQALPRSEAPPAAARIRRDDRSYGFDQPGPDWRAEREARRAQRDRIEAERDMRRQIEADRRSSRDMRQRMDDPWETDPGAPRAD